MASKRLVNGNIVDNANGMLVSPVTPGSVVKGASMLVGYNGKSYITYTLYLGSETFAETTQGYDASQTKPYVLNGKDVVLKANSSIKMKSSVNDNYNDKYVQVNDFDILYR